MAHVLAKDLREAVLQAAIQGKITKQLNSDTLVLETRQNIEKEKNRLIKEKKIKREKLLPITVKESEFLDIPKNWGIIRLGEVISLLSGQDLTSDRYSDKQLGIPYITGASNFVNGNILINRYTSSPTSTAMQGDLLITCKGTIGEIAYLSVEKAHIARQVMSISPIGDANIRYIELLLRYFVDDLKSKAKSMIPGIDRKTVLNIILPFPPIEEQARIVAKVDEIMAKIDEYENLENQLVKLKEQFPQDMKDSLLQAGMMGKLTEQLESDTIVDETSSFNTLDEERFDIPKAWTWFNLKDLMSICTGKKDQNFATRDGAYNFYTCAKEVFKAPNYSFEGESLILPGNGANVGTVTLYNGKFEAYQRTYVLQSINKTINMKFMYYCLLENWNQYNKNKMFGSAIPYIKLGNLQNYPVALPPIEEQQRIVDKLDDLLPLVDKLAELN